MQETKKDIKRVLSFISNICADYDENNCNKCPLYVSKYAGCMIAGDPPEYWVIDEIADIIDKEAHRGSGQKCYKRHRGDTKLQCPYCQTQFMVTIKRWRYMSNHGGKMTIKCSGCGKTFDIDKNGRII